VAAIPFNDPLDGVGVAHRSPLVGQTLVPGDDGYEAARRDTMWNANVPDRFPERIVQANSIDDVVSAMRAAKAAGQQVAVRSGGHSWSGNHVREGGVLLDLSRLTSFTIDREAMTATAEPGLGGVATSSSR
jgi:FAD/FMN-containing dehydrogenase